MPGESAPCTAHSEVNVHSDRDHVPPFAVKLSVDDVLVLASMRSSQPAGRSLLIGLVLWAQKNGPKAVARSVLL
jgi:hypothetical protein